MIHCPRWAIAKLLSVNGLFRAFDQRTLPISIYTESQLRCSIIRQTSLPGAPGLACKDVEILA